MAAKGIRATKDPWAAINRPKFAWRGFWSPKRKKGLKSILMATVTERPMLITIVTTELEDAYELLPGRRAN